MVPTLNVEDLYAPVGSQIGAWTSPQFEMGTVRVLERQERLHQCVGGVTTAAIWSISFLTLTETKLFYVLFRNIIPFNPSTIINFWLVFAFPVCFLCTYCYLLLLFTCLFIYYSCFLPLIYLLFWHAWYLVYRWTLPVFDWSDHRFYLNYKHNGY